MASHHHILIARITERVLMIGATGSDGSASFSASRATERHSSGAAHHSLIERAGAARRGQERHAVHRVATRRLCRGRRCCCRVRGRVLEVFLVFVVRLAVVEVVEVRYDDWHGQCNCQDTSNRTLFILFVFSLVLVSLISIVIWIWVLTIEPTILPHRDIGLISKLEIIG